MTRTCTRISSGIFSLLSYRVAIALSASKRTYGLRRSITFSSLPLFAECAKRVSLSAGQSESPHRFSAHGECGKKAYLRA
jgi:hypothetical protein